MKKLFNCSILLLLVLSLEWMGCQQKKSATLVEDTAHLAITFPEGKPSDVKISTIHPFAFTDSTLAEVKLDSADTAVLALDISKPTLAYLEIDSKWHKLYLTPGDDLKVSVSRTGEEQAITYAGTGSEANNYLAQITQIQERHVKMGGKYIWQLEQEGFMDRLDSMKRAYDEFHRGYTDTVAMPEKLSTALKNRNRLTLVTQKENYELAHYSDDSDTAMMSEKVIREKSKESYYEVPFDTAFLNDALLGYEYAAALKMYLDLYVIWPLYNTISDKEDLSSSDTLPIMADKVIRSSKYPAGIKEFLTAKNVGDFLAAKGITPVIDTIFSNFKKEYPTSAYVAPLEAQYDKWLAIAPGRPAPDFTGATPEGKKLSLSDLKGKVVYIDVWATWCAPCLQEFPHSEKLQQQFEDNNQVVFLYVSVDSDQEKWRKMVADKKLGGMHMINSPEEEDTSLWKAYLISGIPRYILIDQAGKIVHAEASRPSSGQVQGEIQELLTL